MACPAPCATLEGFQLTRKASRIGFDWEDAGGVFEKMREETEELKKALGNQNHSRIEEELETCSSRLYYLSAILFPLKVDPEIALKKANAKFARRFPRHERLARESGREFKDVPREEMETYWEAAKSWKGSSTRLNEPERAKR